MIPKTDFLLICAGTITPKGSINSGNFEKLHCSLSKIINNKQVLVYGVLETKNDLWNLWNFENLLAYFCAADSEKRNKISLTRICL